METKDLILIDHFCTNYEIEFSFIDSLHTYGLIEVVVHDNNKYIAHDKIKDVEKMIRLHYELDINMEGIDVISNLLNRIDSLQKELITTRNRLKIYEEE